MNSSVLVRKFDGCLITFDTKEPVMARELMQRSILWHRRIQIIDEFNLFDETSEVRNEGGTK